FGTVAPGAHLAVAIEVRDGRDDLIASRRDGRKVIVFDGAQFLATPTPSVKLLELTLAKGRAVQVAAGDINGDGRADIIMSGGLGQKAQISIYSTQSNSLLGPITVLGGVKGGIVDVATSDVDSDGIAEIIVASGPRFRGDVHFFDGESVTPLGDLTFQPFPDRPKAAVFVSGSTPRLGMLNRP
ncbi:MAG: VCBS repeat-containing protein, partial [Chthoniobacteraceae bacterium]